MNPREIIKRPLVTEKVMGQIAENKYSFEVDMKANKTQIKQAIEEIFKVNVVSVNTMIVHGKVKRMGRYEGKRPDWKKAIVTLAEGQRLPFFEGA